MNNQTINILSIDGGGIRGVIPLQILKYIEKITNEKIHNIFHLIAGTSTGGLLASCLALPDETSAILNKRKFSLADIETIFTDDSTKIFPYVTHPMARTSSEISSVFKSKFSPKELSFQLNERLGTRRISSCLTPIMVASYDLKSNSPLIFTTRESSNPNLNAKLKDICRATSAAPTFFPSHQFEYNNTMVNCIDGGLVLNNPSFGAVIEVLGHSSFYNSFYNNSNINLKDVNILSLATGYSQKPFPTKNLKWGQYKWAKPAISIAMDGTSMISDGQLKLLFYENKLINNYLRINLPLEANKTDMSNSHPDIVRYWKNEINELLKENSSLRTKIKLFLRKSGINLTPESYNRNY